MTLLEAREILKRLSRWCSYESQFVSAYYYKNASWDDNVFGGLEHDNGGDIAIRMEASVISSAIEKVSKALDDSVTVCKTRKWISYYDRPTDSWTKPRKIDSDDPTIPGIGTHTMSGYKKHYAVVIQLDSGIDDTEYILYKMKRQFRKENKEVNGSQGSAVH